MDWNLRKRKSSSQEVLQELVNTIYEEDYETRRRYPPPRSNSKKIDEGLFAVGNVDLRNRIKNCMLGPENKTTKYSAICGSVYCRGCRNLLAHNHYKRVADRINNGDWETDWLLKEEATLFEEYETFFNQRKYTNDDFLHITGVCGITKIAKSEVESLIKQDTKKWRKIRYNLNKLEDRVYWIECCYEFELVNWHYLRSAPESDYKKQQVKQLIGNARKRFFDETFVFVHFHGITNVPKNKLKDVFQDLYYIGNKPLIKTNRETGLYIQKLRSTQTLEENIRKITSYPFKDAYRFKHSFRGNDFTNGEFFTDEELGRIITLHYECSGRGFRTLFRSCCNELIVWNNVYINLKQFIDTTKKYNKRQRRDENSHQIWNFLMELTKILNSLENRKGNVSHKRITDHIRQMFEVLDLKFNQYGNPTSPTGRLAKRTKMSLMKIINTNTLSTKIGEPFNIPKSKNRKYLKYGDR